MNHWKTYSVFISSTFSDMQSERDYLTMVVLPRLNRELRSLCVTLRIIDLRWGIDTRKETEKDVEEKILIPMLKLLGYREEDWTRQLSQKAGRRLKAIPDFVFFPKGERHFASAPMVIEAKLDMSLVTEQQNAFSQGLSYAKMLRSSIMGICDKERLILYKVDNNGFADQNSPIFEEHWASIYGDSEIGAKLNQLIGREVIINM